MQIGGETMWLAPLKGEEREKLAAEMEKASLQKAKDTWLWEGSGKAYLVSDQKERAVELLNKMQMHAAMKQLRCSNSKELLASKKYFGEKREIPFGKHHLGSKDFFVIAGPCALEDVEDFELQVKLLKKKGVNLVRAGCYKPRTSPYSFTGIEARGYELLGNICREEGMFCVSEVLDERSLEEAAAFVDVFQIGARNMHNHSLLKKVARYGRKVLLKRGLCATYHEWLLSAECLLNAGCFDVILCERGIRSFCDEGRFTLDLQALCAMKEKTHLPIIVDPSHACGKSAWVPSMAKAALAAGADGIMVEVHPDPASAQCDGDQALTIQEFEKMHQELGSIAAALGRSIC